MKDDNPLERAIALTEEILAMLDDGQAGSVNELEIQRKTYIEQAFMQPVAQIDPIRAQHLRNLNQQVVDKLTLFKQAIVLRQAQLRNGARASQAYLAIDSDPI
jgi:hypothetical protein